MIRLFLLLALLMVSAGGLSAQTESSGTSPSGASPSGTSPSGASGDTPFQAFDLEPEDLPTYDQNDLSALVRYPEEARKAGLEGKVVLKMVVSTEGVAEQVEVLESTHPLFTESSLAALKALRFTPGRKDGRAVPVYVVIPFKFALD